MLNGSKTCGNINDALAQCLADNKVLREENAELNEHVRILSKKVQYLLAQMFAKKSEKIDPAQLLFALAGLDAAPADLDNEPEPPPSQPSPVKRKRKRKTTEKLPEHLPVEVVFIDPDEVKSDPSAYRCIGQEQLEELEVYPPRFVRKRIIRRKYVKRTEREFAPIIALAPKRLFEASFASPSLLTYIIIAKYVDHQPLYRQQQAYKARYNVDINIKTMNGWMWGVANWLQLIYEEMKNEILSTRYLQVDETVIKYIDPGRGYAAQGYLWTYHAIGTGVVFDWHAGRGAVCVEGMLDNYDGYIQTDGYQAYQTYNRQRVKNGKSSLTQLACWAHARRYFYKAEKESSFARWMIRQIQLLYAVESRLRKQHAGSPIRQAVRSAESTMILNRIKKALHLMQFKYLPQSATGKAIAYTMNLWKQLTVYTENGILEIDNNLVENAIRPTAVGKKNWLFFGAEAAGKQSAILYSILETCRKLGINQYDYLLEVLTQLPHLTNQQMKNMTPARWLQRRQKMVS